MQEYADGDRAGAHQRARRRSSACCAELRAKGAGPTRRSGREAFFNAEQNALVARNAELYYRTMVRGGAQSWNVRDTHMIETLERLLQHHGPDAKAIVWEHNTHVGDARATDMARAGMVNVGSARARALGRRRGARRLLVVPGQRHRGERVGRADAAHARARGARGQLGARLAPGRRPATAADDGRAGRRAPRTDARGHRAIGVVYHPDRESHGNYVPSVLPYRYDAMLYIDHSHALRPLKMEGVMRARAAGDVSERDVSVVRSERSDG